MVSHRQTYHNNHHHHHHHHHHNNNHHHRNHNHKNHCAFLAQLSLSIISVIAISAAVEVVPVRAATDITGPKTLLVLTDGVDITTDQCGTAGSGQSGPVMADVVGVVGTWLRSVATEDVDFLELSSACGDAQSSVLQLMDALTSRNVIGVLAITTSQTGQAIDDVMNSVDVPLVRMATGNDVMAASTNQNRFLVSHYIENQLSISLEIINRLNWTAFTIDTKNARAETQYLHRLEAAAIDMNLCVLPDVQSETTPRVVVHPYSDRETPNFGCYENVVYLGPGIDDEFLSDACSSSNRSILAAELRDGKWSSFCLTLLRTTVNSSAKPQSLLNTCSVDVLSDASAADTAMNAGNAIAALSFLLKSSNVSLRQASCNENLITGFMCIMFGDSLFEIDDDESGRRIVGKQVQTSYRLYQSNGDNRVSQSQIALSKAPSTMTNKSCKESCHLCYKCDRAKVSGGDETSGGISVSRDFGDLFLVGLFPLHTSSSIDEESCDVTNPLGHAQALAFLHAVDDAMSDPQASKIAQSIRGVVLDSCSSSFKASSLIHSIHACQASWAVSDVDGSKGDAGGTLLTLQPNSILAYFHATPHQISIESIGNQPVISLTKSGFSTSGDTSKVFVQHLIEVLTRLDWTAVNVIVSNDPFFEKMRGYLQTSLQTSHSMCFVKDITLIPDQRGSLVSAIVRAAEKSTVFVLLTSDWDTRLLLDAIGGAKFGSKLQFILTPWNKDVQEHPVIQTVTDENIILEPLVNATDLTDVESMKTFVNFSTYSIPVPDNSERSDIDFESLVTRFPVDITHVVSSVRSFFAAIASDGRVASGPDVTRLGLESTGLVVVAENVARKLKQTIARVDDRYESLEFFSSGPHSQCRGWCPECHTCQGKPRSPTTFFYRPGDLILTGLFPLHKEGPRAFQCGRKQDSQADYLNVFAFIFALETFRSRYPELNLPELSALSVGGLVLDTCSSSFTAAKIISDFETCGASFGKNLSRGDSERRYDTGPSTKTSSEGMGPSKIISNSSSSSSSNSSSSSSVLQASPSAYQNLGYLIADDVMDADALKSTLRGSAFGDAAFITDELVQAQYVARAVLEIATDLGWTHLFLIAENSPYYQSIAGEIITRSTSSEVCIVFQTVLEARFEWRVESAMEGYEHFPVVLISRKSSAYSLFDWLGDLAKSYFWILTAVTSDWSHLDPNTIPLGSVVVRSPPAENADFANWLTQPLDRAQASAWLKDYWQYRYSCLFDYDSASRSGDDTVTSCSVDALKDENPALTPVTSHIIRTVDAILYKVHTQHFNLCRGVPGICAEITEEILEKKLGGRDVSFAYQGEEVGVDANGLVSVTLSVFNIQHLGSVKVGSFFRSSLDIAKENVSLFHPNGSAAHPFLHNQQHHLTRPQCRHGCSCVISVNTTDGSPDDGALPAYLYREYQGEFLGDLWAIIVSAVAGTGVLVTIVFISYVLYKVCKRAIGKRYVGLGLYLLASLIVLYSSVLPFVISASEVVCGLRFLFHSVAFGLVFAGVLVKLMSIQSYTIIGLGGEISSVNQFITIFFVVGVQVAISALWWVYNAPMMVSKTTEAGVRAAGDVTKYACGMDRAKFAYFHCYLAALLLLCSFYATAVRNEKKNMGEARLLMVSCWLCVAVWVAWPVCLFVLDREMTEVVTCAAILLCATLILLVIFVPKVRMVARLKYNISHKDAMKNGYTVDTDFFYERPFSLPGTLTSTFSTSKVNPPKPLSHLNSDVNY